MALKYETGIATIAQLIIMTALNFVNGAFTSVQSCTNGGNDCVSNVILNLLFFMLITGWFAFLWILGYTAQDRRSRRMAQILLVAEVLVVLVSLVDARHYPNILGLITSLADAALAAWVALLAFRLMRAKGGRVRSLSRPRRRPSTSK
jgi:hypothetical protein